MGALRRLCFPCFSSSAVAVAGDARPPTKKRLSTSLRDDIIKKDEEEEEEEQEQGDESPTSSTASAQAQPRPSKSMVIGTIFGSRRGHVWFCVQHDRLAVRPLLLIEFPIPTHQLVAEMRYGVVRIALECASADPAARVWAVSVNGRKQLGFAAKRRAGERVRAMLRTMQSSTVGAGVIPGGGAGEEEVMYMRANYEHVLGNGASESFHLVSPEQCPSQELSVFLLPSSRKPGVSSW